MLKKLLAYILGLIELLLLCGFAAIALSFIIILSPIIVFFVINNEGDEDGTESETTTTN